MLEESCLPISVVADLHDGCISSAAAASSSKTLLPHIGSGSGFVSSACWADKATRISQQQQVVWCGVCMCVCVWIIKCGSVYW